MLTKNINFSNYLIKKKNKLVKLQLRSILKKNDQVIKSLRKSYKDSYSFNNLKIFNNKLDYRIIGMGGSTLGAQAIYNFFKKKLIKIFALLIT